MSKVYFIGAGPGDPELITLKAKKLIEEADVIIYSGSLLNPKILEDARGELYDAAKMDREEINNILAEAALNGRLAIRLHDGDPSIYGAIREQIDKLESKGIECQVIPGISALFAAASRLNLELTLPGITQTVIITRAEARTPVPDREKIEELAKHKSTMAFYLSVHLIDKVVKELIKGGYEEDTPVAVVYRATWDDEIIIKGKLNDIARKVKDARINKTAIIIVGYVIEPKMYEYSKVYDPNFTHGYRRAK
jgi:precorrin-4/cobalt-precorrin-4 C11-methyltransferase